MRGVYKWVENLTREARRGKQRLGGGAQSAMPSDEDEERRCLSFGTHAHHLLR